MASLIATALALGVLVTPVAAGQVPQAHIDSLANLTLGPRLCHLQTGDLWIRMMTETVFKYNTTMEALAAQVDRAADEWYHIYRQPGHKAALAHMCQLVRRLIWHP